MLPASDPVAPDLFAADKARPSPTEQGCSGIDGHRTGSRLQAQVCNWLYLAQLAHATQRALPVEESLHADFFLPAGSVYIDCWQDSAAPSRLSAKLRNKEVCKEYGLRHLEVKDSDAERLDEVLGRGLLAFGIRC